MTAKWVWVDGKLVDWTEATVHVASFGLHYGIGFFEGVRCHQTTDGRPAIFRLLDHIQRLGRSAAIYRLSLPFSDEVIATACKEVVLRNGYANCYIRPIAFLGEGQNPLAAPLRFAVIASEHGPLVGAQTNGGVTAKIASFERIGANAIPPAAKATGQYLNSFLAQTEVLRGGADEAILLNREGQVTDGWAHNIFVVSGDVLVTPPLSTGALAGITRDSIMKLADEDGMAVEERVLVRSDLYLADECFLSGTAAGLVPVISVDGRVVGKGQPGDMTCRLTALLEAVAGGETAAHAEWRTYLS
jgi:branched-chain amino acid aminotransferase